MVDAVGRIDHVADVVALFELFEFLAASRQFRQDPLRVAVVHLLVMRRTVAVALLERVLVEFHFLFQTVGINQTVSSLTDPQSMDGWMDLEDGCFYLLMRATSCLAFRAAG